MSEPTLVILAAGMGSRFGGLKQIMSVDERGHAIIDYSLFDARRAGFKKVAFIIKHEIEADFKAAVGTRMEKYFDVEYVFQQLDRLPAGYEVPAGRVKPWGTGHAVLCAKDQVDGPFAVINADDFYGRDAFAAAARFLLEEGDPNEHAMVGYNIENTLTENGTVSRGECAVVNGMLDRVTGIDCLNGKSELERRTRAATIVRDLKKQMPLQRIAGFSVSADEQRLAMLHLRGELSIDAGMRRLLLIRANEQLAGERITRPRSLNAVPIIPERVPTGSQFAAWPAGTCDYWAQRIGNFVLTQKAPRYFNAVDDFGARRDLMVRDASSRRFPLTRVLRDLERR